MARRRSGLTCFRTQLKRHTYQEHTYRGSDGVRRARAGAVTGTLIRTGTHLQEPASGTILLNPPNDGVMRAGVRRKRIGRCEIESSRKARVEMRPGRCRPDLIHVSDELVSYEQLAAIIFTLSTFRFGASEAEAVGFAASTVPV